MREVCAKEVNPKKSWRLTLDDLGPLERNPTRTKEKFVLAGLLFSFQWDSFWDFVLVGFRVLSTLLHNTAFLLGVYARTF